MPFETSPREGRKTRMKQAHMTLQSRNIGEFAVERGLICERFSEGGGIVDRECVRGELLV